MGKPLVCLCLTGKTLAEDVEIAKKYQRYIDLVELRVDWLEEDERLNIRDFPSMVGIPTILTIRRIVDGGRYEEGEASRTMLFARALAFADSDSANNFAYVDFEEDFNVPSLEDAALAFGTKIIRSFHDMKNPVKGLKDRLAKMRVTGYEIPKIACMPHNLADVTELFREASELPEGDQILIAMGSYGLPTRILAERMHSYLTFTSPAELSENLAELGQIDPITLCNQYHFKSITRRTVLYGITGFPLKVTSSPKLHNAEYEKQGMDAVFIPFKSDTVEEAKAFADFMGIKGFSITIPHKEKIISQLDSVDPMVEAIGACNTAVHEKDGWKGYNTDCIGFEQSIKEFTALDSLKGKKVAIIGAGGASKAVAHAIHNLGAQACVFNRTMSKAKSIADRYGFDYASLGPESIDKLRAFSDIIVQTTSKGMGSTDPSNIDNDPIYFFDFEGTEMISDIVYAPEVTPVMARAKEAGCKVDNGYAMLRYQGEAQFKLYKGVYE